jgi:cell division protein FtsL
VERVGLPALKIEHEAGHVRPHLRLVRTGPTAAARRSAAQAVAYEAFVTFCVLVAVLALAALGRVWLSAEAAEATLDSSKLREDIKTARFEGDMLEVQQSRLASAGRIRLVASRSLGMAPAEKTSYIDLRPDPAKQRPVRAVPAPKAAATKVASGVVDSMVSIAAGEARVLLVGDVGLASPR